jgi:hypothetical protein
MKIGIAITAFALLAGCEKAGPKASGELSTAEAELFTHLPRDADFAFGGNFMKLQNVLKKGALGKIMQQAESMSPGLSKWTDCFASHESLVMVGTVTAKSTMEMRFVMKGIGIEDMERCAKEADYGVTIDPDKKYISIKQEGLVSQTLGYLVLADGSLYGKTAMAMGMDFKTIESDRKSLEADIATTSKDSALSNTKLLALVEKTDRTKAMWFAGNADNTPIAEYVGDIHGSFDLGDGFDIDVTAFTKDEKFAKQAVDGLDEMKQAAGMFSPDLKDILGSAKLSRSGEKLRFEMKISASQLDTLMSLSTRGL